MLKKFFWAISSLFFTVGYAQVKTGIDVLEELDFSPLEGKRVGLVTNPTGVDCQLRSTVDVLYASKKVQLKCLFAPEHGVRGNLYAGQLVKNTTDETTGLPVYSIHGSSRKPTAAMLQNIDALVYDIQDIGCRSYTFISSLGLCMEAAAEQGKEVIVLDRPNPLGGLKVEGCGVKPGFFSFVSQFDIPYIYGLTVGELATYLNSNRPVEKRCRLTVIKMEGWKRTMTFDQTGLPWVPTSPQIPSDETALFYPTTGIFGELSAVNIGVGYTLPFRVFAAKWINAEKYAAAMNALQLPGVVFRPISFKPYFSVGSGEMMHGVQIYITDYERVRLTELQFYLVQEIHRLWPDKDVFALGNPKSFSMFDNVCGTNQIRNKFGKRFLVSDILTLWREGEDAFKEKSKAYWLY